MSVMAYVRHKLRRLREFGSFRGIVFFAQRRVLHPDARGRLARFVARFLPKPTLLGTKQTAEAITLQRDGFTMLDGIATPQMIEKMRRHLSQQLVYAPYTDELPHLTIDDPNVPDTHILTVVDDGLMACPHLLDIANHPRIIAAVEGVFGCKPTIGFMTAWWSIPTPEGKPRHAEYFHRDFDDVAFIKLFVYLTDVEAENGPHEFILGSHSDAALRPIRRYTDAEVMANFSANRLLRFIGRAGTAFLENTTGLHRGLPVAKGRRLILQIVYSMLPMAYGPAKPYSRNRFQQPSVPIDAYTNRIYVEPH